jgi:hypothetical protein
MSYLVETDQQERIGLSPQQQAQSMQLNVNFDTTGYPIATIATIAQNQPVTVSETSKKNSLLAVGALAVALMSAGAIGHYLGASGEAKKAQQQQTELTNTRSDIDNLCKKYPTVKP